jgi:ABC-2 type transport system permease protein
MNRFSRLKQLWLLTLSLLRELIREPGVLFWGVVFPILMTVGLGLAFTKKADVIRKVAVITDELSPVHDSSALFSFLDNRCRKNSTKEDGYGWKLEIKNEKLGSSIFLFTEMKWEDAMVLLKRGTINLILSDKDGNIEYHFDPLNSDAELTYLKLTAAMGSGNIITEEKAAEIKPLTVTGTRYIDFLVPGLISMGVMMSAMWGISYGIIEKRSKKLRRRLVATPMRKSHFLVALISVRIAMNFAEALILFLFALLAFHMSIQGSLSAMILLFLAGNIAFAGMAVLVSSHTSNTEVGNGLINAIVTPMMVLSGIFFSYHNFPDWSQPVISKLPLTILTDGIRSIFNEGAGYQQVALPILILTLTGVVFFTIAVKIFKWH